MYVGQFYLQNMNVSNAAVQTSVLSRSLTLLLGAITSYKLKFKSIAMTPQQCIYGFTYPTAWSALPSGLPYRLTAFICLSPDFKFFCVIVFVLCIFFFNAG